MDESSYTFEDLVTKDPVELVSSNLNTVPKDFKQEAKSFFTKLYEGLIKLDDQSVTIESYNNGQIKVKTVKGVYIISIEDNKFITLNSPVSGYFRYTLDSVSGFFVNIKDDHIIDDLLIREFCKHSKGILSISG